MARFDPIKELAIGDVDGVNKIFKTPIPYVSNTVIPYRNGHGTRPSTAKRSTVV